MRAAPSTPRLSAHRVRPPSKLPCSVCIRPVASGVNPVRDFCKVACAAERSTGAVVDRSPTEATCLWDVRRHGIARGRGLRAPRPLRTGVSPALYHASRGIHRLAMLIRPYEVPRVHCRRRDARSPRCPQCQALVMTLTSIPANLKRSFDRFNPEHQQPYVAMVAIDVRTLRTAAGIGTG